MDALMKLPRDTQIILGGLFLYFIFSFLDWQSAFGYGVNEWHGFGVLVALIGVATLLWEAARAFDVKLPTGTVSPGLISVSLALVLAVFTVIIFLDWSDFRSWPEWVGLILALVIGGFALKRARDEGVQMPNLPKNTTSFGSGSGTGPAPSPPAPMAGGADEGGAGADSTTGGV
jgi:hypothetical protein